MLCLGAERLGKAVKASCGKATQVLTRQAVDRQTVTINLDSVGARKGLARHGNARFRKAVMVWKSRLGKFGRCKDG